MNAKFINVAMISFYYLPEYSGSAKQATNLIKELSKKGVSSFVIAAQLEASWPRYESLDGIEIFRVPVMKKNPLLSFWKGAAKILWKKRREYDIVHSHGMNPVHGFPLFFGKLLGKPTLGKLTIANSDINFNSQGRLFGRLHRYFLRFVDRYIAISSVLVEELKHSGLNPDKCMYIPNGVNTEIFYPNNEKQSKEISVLPTNNENDIKVLYVGVIDKRKGLDNLLPAFKSLAEQYPQSVLFLVGPKNREDYYDHFYNSMKEITADLEKQHRVVFIKYTDNIVSCYRAADVFVLPSRQEGMPNVILEAMACGLPVIGTNISGSEDLIENQINGYLVNCEDQNALAKALQNLLSNKEKRDKMGQESIKRIEKKYALYHIADKYIELYNGLLTS